MNPDVFCRCCLQIGNKCKLMDMESGHFVYNNKRISFIEGYCGTLDVDSSELDKVPVVNMKICQLCVVHLESAYAFRLLCKQTNKILEQKYATFGAVKIKREDLYEDFEEELNYIPEKIYKPSHRPTPPMVIMPGISSSPTGLGESEPELEEHTTTTAPTRKSAATAEKPHRIRRNRSDGKFECMVCGKGYKHKKAAMNHLEQSHLDSDGDEEFFKLRRPPTPKHHAKSNTTENYKCQKCALSFDSFDFYNEHMKSQHYQDEERDFSDDEQEHVEEEQVEDDRMGASPELVFIDAEFSNSGGGDDQSNQSMSSKELTQQSNPAKRIPCPDCPRKFKTTGGLRVHQNAEHLNVKYTCEQCPDRHFKTFSYLQYHKKVEHLNMRYTCKVCSEQLRSMQLLWSHSFVHRDFVPFNCEQFNENCNYKTANKGHFNTHLLKIHKVKFDEDIHGYHAESRDEVLSHVR